MEEGVPIILLSGMAGDERLFASQTAAFPKLRVQTWVPPRDGESLRAYAVRLAPLIDPRCPCLVGGASFGGIVALELATHLPVLGCILIGSIRSPAELPIRWRLLLPVAMLGPHAMRILAGMAARLAGPFLKKGSLRRLNRVTRPEAGFLRWAICAVILWRPSSVTRRIRVFHIHGSEDRVLPVGLVRPDVVVPGGSHALALFNPAAVNEFIAGVVRAIATQREHSG